MTFGVSFYFILNASSGCRVVAFHAKRALAAASTGILVQPSECPQKIFGNTNELVYRSVKQTGRTCAQAGLWASYCYFSSVFFSSFFGFGAGFGGAAFCAGGGVSRFGCASGRGGGACWWTGGGACRTGG